MRERERGFNQRLWQAGSVYGRHPELMTPFVLQALLGLGVNALLLRQLARGAPELESLALIWTAVLSVVHLLLQGWALRWTHDLLQGQARPGFALRLALRKGLSLLAVSLVVALPGSALLLLLSSLTSGWVATLGLTLAATLVSWVALFAALGVVAQRRRVGEAVREGFLLLGGTPRLSVALFLVLLGYGLISASFTAEATWLILTGEALGVSRWGGVGLILVGVLLSPGVYLLLVQFYRESALGEEVEA